VGDRRERRWEIEEKGDGRGCESTLVYAFSEASPDQLCGYKMRSLSVLGANTGTLRASKSRCDGHSYHQAIERFSVKWKSID